MVGVAEAVIDATFKTMMGLVLLVAVLIGLSPANAEKRIALTFDDVPRDRGAFFTPDERSQKLLTALKQAKVKQAAFFLNPGSLNKPDGQGGEKRIMAYVAAGHVIANHSFSHPSLKNNSTEDYLADIDKTAVWLTGRKGYRPWFRFPYLDEGAGDKVKRDAVRAGLKTRGLRNGYVTADGSDWHLEALTVKAAKDGKKMDMAALRRLYIGSQMSGIEYHDTLARRTLGRSPAHVMLLHETDLAAMFIGDLVAELRLNGWTIISADEAYADPLSKAIPDVDYSWGTLTGSMAWEKGVDPPLSPVWMKTDMISYLFEKNVIRNDSAE